MTARRLKAQRIVVLMTPRYAMDAKPWTAEEIEDAIRAKFPTTLGPMGTYEIEVRV